MSRLRCSIIAVCGLLLVAPAWPAETKAGWELLKSLTGEWEAKSAEGTMSVSYRVVSEGNALMETMLAPEHKGEMITMYHRDGDALVATHYCAMGNQPRMRATSVEPSGKKIVFHFMDVTNLSSPNAYYMRELAVSIPDADHLVQEWTARGNGKDSTVTFSYTRKK